MSRRPPHSPPRRAPHSPPAARTRVPLWARLPRPGFVWDPNQPPTPEEIHATEEWLKYQRPFGPMERRDIIACRWFRLRANGVEDIEQQLRQISANVAPWGGTPEEVRETVEFMQTHWKGATCDA